VGALVVGTDEKVKTVFVIHAYCSDEQSILV